MKSISIALQVVLLLLPNLVFGQKINKIEKINTNNSTQHIDINNFDYWFMNDGKGATDPTKAYRQGGYFPKGTSKSLIYQDGIVWSGKVILPNGKKELKAGGSTYLSGMQRGKIITNGIVDGVNYTRPLADDTSKSEYRIFKIQKGWENLTEGSIKDNLKNDYENWPINQGAPQENGTPDFRGDQVLFYVSNDLDSVKTKLLYDSKSIGMEVQTLIFGFKDSPLNNSVFIRKLLINKSGLLIDSMYISLWSDPDIGDASDDFVGVDTLLKTAFAYNGSSNDTVYLNNPPALGYTFFQTPKVPGNINDNADFNGKKVIGLKNQELSSFFYYLPNFVFLVDPPLGNRAFVLNKNQQGFNDYGHPIFNNSGLPTKFPLSGNPVSGSGEIDGIEHGKDDRRFLLSSGPFSMAPNDSQEIVVGITVGFGGNYLSNITDLKGKITSLSKSTILEVHSSNNSPKRSFSLIGNYPNPFNPSTNIEFNLETGSTISIDIFNLLGQKIKSIQNGYLTNGKHSVKWNGKDEKGKSVGSGLYFARISDGKMSVTQKLILEK